ncbi:MAG: polysulfide reductase NrfD [Actinobacteria bacterium]|nr:polysulfide reductase NrfD [Actinomycetota bacterium]
MSVEARPAGHTGRRKGDRFAVVPDVEVRTYYDQPVIREPTWTWEIPWYLFSGGLAGASATLALAARLAGDDDLARALERAALAGTLASPVLLVSDLGRPSRFSHMLRVFKPTSPMSMGSWILAGFGPAAVGAAVLGELGWFPRLRRAAQLAAGVLGPALATYTAVLLADTAVPVWHEARRELPFVFAGGALASAGGAACVLAPPPASGPARRAAALGVGVELLAAKVMEDRLGTLAEPYRLEPARRWKRLAAVLGLTGAAVLASTPRRSRLAAVAGGGFVMAGAACERLAVFKAGFTSARDPRATVAPQQARAASGGAGR